MAIRAGNRKGQADKGIRVLKTGVRSTHYINLIMRLYCRKISEEVKTISNIIVKNSDDFMTDYWRTKVTTMGNVIEHISCQKTVTCPCVKLDDNFYLDTRTGEVFEYQHFETRADGLQGIRRTMSRIRALINTNVTVSENIRWVTLTYAENMTDTKRLYQDYKYFWDRFLYYCKKSDFSKPEYISVIEPQGRGAWHVHAFFIWDKPAPFVPNNVLSDIWGQGFVKIKALRDCDNIGSYFSAYLADMPVEDVIQLPVSERNAVFDCGVLEEKNVLEDDGIEKSKEFIKGGRLCFYPAKMNIVRYSRGIKQPDVQFMTGKQAKEKASSAKLTFSRSYEIVDDGGKVVNRISKEYYNMARK